MKWAEKYRWTIIALLCSSSLLLCSILMNLDLYEILNQFLEEMEHLELDEIMLFTPPCIAGFLIDRQRSRRQKINQIKLREQHLATLEQTLHTAQDIINNFLNSIQLYIYKAHDEKLQSTDVESLENLIQKTTQRLNALEKPLDTE